MERNSDRKFLPVISDRISRGFLLILVIVPIFLSEGMEAQGRGKIYEPFFVAHPPDNAFNGLVLLPGGELRHYGFEGDWFHPSAYIYLSSTDNGLTWTRKTLTDPDLFTDENAPPAARSPWSGDYIRLAARKDGTWVYRSKTGIDGPYEKKRIDTMRCDMFRQPCYLKNTGRILVTCGRSIILDGEEVMQSCLYLSDDDGYTWDTAFVAVGPRFVSGWPHKKPRWQNYAIEPTITELADGKIWMLLRTSMDQLYEAFSYDMGKTWTAPAPSGFYSTITMPTLFRMSDGRLILFFCSTTPLPEQDRSADTSIRDEQKNGLWEDVFTNRDVLHAAVSYDDGRTWSGFRELYLNPLRNDSDFATRGGKEVSLDKSVHQSQAVELPDGNLLVAFGQHPLVRSMIIFDPDWLDENERSDDFRDGLKNWTTFKYINGIKGHCAYNRVPGAGLVENPEKKGDSVLQIRHILNPALVCDVDGAVWNFPAALKGSFTTSIYLKPGGKGGSICLTDRWFNPTDTLVGRYSMYSLRFDGTGRSEAGVILTPGRWNEIVFRWDNLRDGICRLIIDGRPATVALPLNRQSKYGINYVHFQSVNLEEDTEGFLIGPVKAGISASENCLDDILRGKLYSGSEDIFNGRKWINEKRYMGTPLLTDDYWPEADILFNGTEYTGILMNYDLSKNELVVYNPEAGREKYVVISRDKLSGFSFIDTLKGRKYFYEYTELDGTKGKALYENATRGKFRLYIKPLKNLEIKSTSGAQGRYAAFYEYYMSAGNNYNRFSTKSQLLKLIPEFSTELKGYIRKNKIVISGRDPEGVRSVISYLNELK